MATTAPYGWKQTPQQSQQPDTPQLLSGDTNNRTMHNHIVSSGLQAYTNNQDNINKNNDSKCTPLNATSQVLQNTEVNHWNSSVHAFAQPVLHQHEVELAKTCAGPFGLASLRYQTNTFLQFITNINNFSTAHGLPTGCNQNALWSQTLSRTSEHFAPQTSQQSFEESVAPTSDTLPCETGQKQLGSVVDAGVLQAPLVKLDSVVSTKELVFRPLNTADNSDGSSEVKTEPQMSNADDLTVRYRL